MESGSYTWRIQDPNLIQQILSAKCVKDSNTFEVGKLQWRLKLVPNGSDEKSKGCCGVGVELLQMPNSWKSILCLLHIECPQIENKMMFTQSYVEPHRWNYFLSSYDELKASVLATKELTIIITLNIRHITLKEKNKVLFQTPTNNYKRNTHFEWKIDKTMMNKLRSFPKAKGIHSDIFNDIWYLTLHPNGNWSNKEGDVNIGLRLCALPPNVSQMSVKWTVNCNEAHIEQKFTSNYDENKANRSGNMNTISFAQFSKYDTWTISVDINVLSEMDVNGNDCTESAWNEYKEKQNDDTACNYLKEKVRFYGVIESLSANMEQIQKQLAQLTEKVSHFDESKEETMQEIAILKQQMNTQQKQKTNPDHEHVKQWLKNEVKLEQYYALFIEHGFEDLESIKSLNIEILNMMKIEKIGHKMKILRCVAQLNISQLIPRVDLNANKKRKLSDGTCTNVNKKRKLNQ